MQAEQRLKLIAEYRQRRIKGTLVEFAPMQPEHTEEVLRLRNSPRAMHNLAQQAPLTPELHLGWYKAYLAREDDIAWMIATHDGAIIGTIALYSVDPAGRIAEKGRLVIDEAAAMRAPYAVEADLLVFRFAFETLALERVVASIRPGNDKVISMHRRIGFEFLEDFDLRSVPYKKYVLERGRFQDAMLERVVQHWSKR